MTTRVRALLLGVGWLLWIWIAALAAPHVAPSRSGPRPWTCDVDRRVTPLARWDSGWYLSIAETGYQAPPARPGEETNHAFFPLYPELMRLLVRSTGIETSRAGNLVSALALLGAVVLFARWVRLRFGEERVTPSILALLVFPTSFFFATVYTEALLLFLALASVLAIEKRHTVLAVTAGFLSGLTRISCVVLAPYLALVSLRKDRANDVPLSRALPRAFLFGVSPLAGFGLFCLYFRRRFGDPLLFVRAQHNWSDAPVTILSGPWLALKTVFDDVTTGKVFAANPARTLEGIYLVLFAVLAVLLIRRRQLPEGLLLIFTVGLVLFSGTFESAGRYVLPAFPAFVVLGGLAGRPALARTAFVLSAAAQLVYVWAFIHWYWAG
jgi:hypothetical protein